MWIAVLSSSEVKNEQPYGARRLGENMVFWRDKDGKVRALRDLCPHRQALLSQGKVVNGMIKCPYHGFEFDGSGMATLVPAMGKSSSPPDFLKAKSFILHEDHGIIWLWYGSGEPDSPPKYFDDINITSHSEYWETWNISFPRAVENQLDVFHLPFVHYNTIGRGNRTLVNGPLVKQLDDLSLIWYTINEVDRGQKPKRGSEIDTKKLNTYLKFIYPNLWENHISENMKIVAFFAPVDPERTVIYIIYYLKVTGSDAFDTLFAKLGMYFNNYVLHQDRRIVQNQNPSVVGDRLIGADAPISFFRRMLFRDKDLIKMLQINKEAQIAP